MIARKTRVLLWRSHPLSPSPAALRPHVEPPSDSSQSKHGQPAEGSRPVGQHVLLRRRGYAPAHSGNGRTGGLKEDTAFFTGKSADGQFVATIPVTVDESVLERGRQRYTIYCQPRHDARGDGKGISVPARQRPHRHFSPGEDPEAHGRADLRRHHERARAWRRVSLADPSCRDRWAIVAYVRGLQRDRQARNASAAAPRACRHPPPPMLRRQASRGSADGVRQDERCNEPQIALLVPSPVW